MHNRVKVKVEWVDAEIFEREDAASYLEGFNGIIVPGGFGERGTEGKIKAAQFAREHKIPYLGVCLGMQMAVIEAARNLINVPDAGSEEFDHEPGKKRFTPVVYHLKEWVQGNHKVRRKESDDKGGTMRLGAYDGEPWRRASRDSLALRRRDERHRHRYEVNPDLIERIEAAGLVYVGKDETGRLPEIVEFPDHPWYIGVQFHPELKSKPLNRTPVQGFCKSSGHAITTGLTARFRFQIILMRIHPAHLRAVGCFCLHKAFMPAPPHFVAFIDSAKIKSLASSSFAKIDTPKGHHV